MENILAEFLKTIYPEKLEEGNVLGRYFAKKSKVEQAKMIVDTFVATIEIENMRELPEDIYNVFEENLSVIENALKTGNCPQSLRKDYFEECWTNGMKTLKKLKKDGGTINYNEKEQMSLDIYERREYRQNGFIYLLDDEEKTAWIKQGRIKRCRRYRLPDHVMIEGERYTIESVEIGAYNYPRTLQHLVIPDTFTYVDGDTLYGLDNLQSVYIGKKVEELSHWNFRLCPKLRSYIIDPENPYMTTRDGMVFSKDRKKVLTWFRERRHLTLPEGVEEIAGIAFWNSDVLESVSFPSTIRKIGDEAFDNCSKLRKVVFPEGLEYVGGQCFWGCRNLEYLDFPSTITEWSYEVFIYCSNLQTLILRMPFVPDLCRKDDFDEVPVKTCRLFVPAELVEQYREHPVWKAFKYILPIEKYANYELPFQTLSECDEVFDLNQIPMEVLDKGWKRYHPYLLKGDEPHPLQFGRPIRGDTPLAVLRNIKTMIINTFEIDEKQFVITEDEGGPLISVLIALCDDNVEVMEAAMQTQWYFKENSPCTQLLEDRKGRRWMNVRFKIADRERILPAYNYLYGRKN